VKYYVKSWFLSCLPKAAPKSDLNLLKSLAKGTLTKLMNHLWYLSEELVALAFFDPGVTLAEKKAMVASLQSEGCEERKHLAVVNQANIQSLQLSDFVTQNTCKFFGILGIRQDF
jgi:hypothetical protein